MFASIIILLNLLSFHNVNAQCSASVKTDCGYTGITKSQCETKGCCWSESSVSGTPWCFFSDSGSNTGSSCFLLTNDNNINTISSAPFSSNEILSFRNNFLKNININGQGGVVAAPDYNTPGGSYYYHWMRDAALTMRW